VGVVVWFKSIEKWASVSPERERLLVILVFAGIGLLVLATFGVTVLVMGLTGSAPA